MEDCNEIRKRIAQRKMEQRQTSCLFSIVYRSIMLIMIVGIGILLFGINSKLQLVSLPQDLFSINFAKVSEWIPFEHWFQSKDMKVQAYPSYALLKENQYANGSNQAYAIFQGTITKIEKAKTYTVTIKQDNGVIISYGNLMDVQGKENERIQKGAILGSFQEYINLDMQKNNQKITLEEAIAPL